MPREKTTLTTRELCDRWAVHQSTICKMVARGKLSMSKVNGWCHYPIDEVETIEREKRQPRPLATYTRTIRVQSAPTGERDAIAFDMFAGGATLIDVVRALKIPFDRVDKLYDAYVNPNLEERRRKRIVDGL